MSIARILKKIKRETVAGISRLYVDHVSTDYLGMKLKVPLIHGLNNGGYFIPGEMWMGECLRAFLATRDGCIVDVGANVGVYLVKLRVLDRECDYYGIEPDPACAFYIKEIIRLNGFERSQVFCFALDMETGVKKFYTSKTGDKMGSLIREGHEHRSLSHSFDTFVLSGDSFIESLELKKPVSVLKIDVEGAELNVLRGLKETIAKHRPYIFCEILEITDQSQAENASSICDFLESNEYEVLGINKNTGIFQVLDDTSRAGKDFEEEYIFSPGEHVDELLGALAQNDCGISVKI